MKSYYSLIRHFRKNLGLSHPVSVRRCNLPDGYDGDTCFRKNKFFVRIKKDLEQNSAIDTLIHEMSHCISWEVGNNHNNHWGIAYSRVYREYIKWLEKHEAQELQLKAAKFSLKRKAS